MHNFDFSIQPTITDQNFVKRNKAFLENSFGNASISPLFIADMDFKVAPVITEAFKEIANRGVFSYEFPPEGTAEALVGWYQRQHNLSLDAQKFEVIHGVLTGLAILYQEFSEPNDKIVIQTPVYHQFAYSIRNNNRQVIENPLVLKEGTYTMDFEQLEHTFKTEHPKLFLVCNPHNPVGRVWKKEELTQLVKLCKKYNVVMLSDEIHSDIIFTPNAFTSLTEFDYENIIALLGSPAKTFGLQGAAAGFIYTNNGAYQKRIRTKIESMYLNHVPSILLYGIKAAYEKGDSWLEALMDYLTQSRKWITDYINHEMEGVSCITSEGTYQLWMDFRALELDNKSLDELLFQKAGVGLAPGHWFGKDGSGFARINFATPLPYLQKELKKLNTILHD